MSGERSSPAAVRAEVVALVREKRYHDALGLLRRLRSQYPEDHELTRSAEGIEQFLAGRYSRRLGGIDRVAGPIPVEAARSVDAITVSRYIDGVATFGQIAEVSPLGRLRTLEVLVQLYAPAQAPAPPRPVPAPAESPLARLEREVAELAARKRHAEALARLYEARKLDPHDRELQRLIHRVTEAAQVAWAERLGDLDELACPLPQGAANFPDALLVAQLIDGYTTYREIVERSPLGRLRTLEVLVELYVDGGSNNEYGSYSVTGGEPVPAPEAVAPPADELYESLYAEPQRDTQPYGRIIAIHDPIQEEQHYRESLARGMEAFAQRRHAEALAAFEECAALRPDDQVVVSLRERVRRELGRA